MNYRSVIVLGLASEITKTHEKVQGLERISEHVLPGRWREARAPTVKELKATMLLSVGLTEASAKTRTGPPRDAVEDYSLAVWAGEIPLRLASGTPIGDPKAPTRYHSAGICAELFGEPQTE